VTSVENEIAISARPEAVWRVLTDFDAYPRWNAFVRFSGTPAVGEELDYRYRFANRLIRVRWVKAFARVTAFEAPSVFAWTIGSRGLLLVEEEIRLDRHPTGTRLTHSIRHSGLVVMLAGKKLRRQAYERMCETDAALRSFFAPRGPVSKGPRRPRKGFRK
jgi:hypothetical protein